MSNRNFPDGTAGIFDFFEKCRDACKKSIDISGRVYYNKKAVRIRGVAQLVARLLWEQDVGGSNPFTPTIIPL